MFPKPEGVERSFSETLFLELVQRNDSTSASYSYPPDVVPGSQRAHVALVGTSTIRLPCCASGSSIRVLFMFTFSQLGVCYICLHFSFVSSLGLCASSSAPSCKTFEYCRVNENGNDGHQTGMFMAGKFWTAVWLFGLAPFRLRDVGYLSW